MNYIGVDCHISSLDLAVVNERGTTTRKEKVATGVKELIRNTFSKISLRDKVGSVVMLARNHLKNKLSSK